MGGGTRLGEEGGARRSAVLGKGQPQSLTECLLCARNRDTSRTEGAGSLPSWSSRPRGETQTVNMQMDEGKSPKLPREQGRKVPRAGKALKGPPSLVAPDYFPEKVWFELRTKG